MRQSEVSRSRAPISLQRVRDNSCQWTRDRLSRYLDGELRDADESVLLGHLARCTRCEDALALEATLLTDTIDALLPGSPSTSVTPRVMQEVRATTALASRSRPDQISMRGSAFRAAAAMLLLLLPGFWLCLPGGETAGTGGRLALVDGSPEGLHAPGGGSSSGTSLSPRAFPPPLDVDVDDRRDEFTRIDALEPVLEAPDGNGQPNTARRDNHDGIAFAHSSEDAQVRPRSWKILGDVNGDGSGLSSADVHCLVEQLAASPSELTERVPCSGAADFDGDRSLDIADVSGFCQWVFASGPLDGVHPPDNHDEDDLPCETIICL